VGIAVDWVRRIISTQGRRPGQIIFDGPLGGRTHVASYLSHPAFHHAPEPEVRGVLCLSGQFEVTLNAAPDEEFFVRRERAYFGDDLALRAAQSSIPGLVRSETPLLIVNAELDPPYFLRQTATLKAAFQSGGPQRVLHRSIWAKSRIGNIVRQQQRPDRYPSD